MSGATVRCKFVASAKRAPCRTVARAANSPKPRGPSRTARMLALAHYVERLVEAGELSGYAEAARVLGLTRARLTQVMGLLLLAPAIQARILDGKLEVSERRMRTVVAEAGWTVQVSIPSRAAP